MAHQDQASYVGSPRPVVRQITPTDLKTALKKGWDDFNALPSFAIFLVVLYPIIAFLLARVLFGYDVLVISFPLVMGYALIGPLAASGLYELSRRRELGLDVSWSHAFDVFRSPSFITIAALGVVLMAIFIVWLGAAQAIFVDTLGSIEQNSFREFATRVFTTPEGHELIFVGCSVGFLFALITLTFGVISFPLLVDRNVGPVTAVWTSVRAMAKNPVTMLLWGLIVGALLFIGASIAFFGLAVAIPVLGHASWHLYRLVVEPE